MMDPKAYFCCLQEKEAFFENVVNVHKGIVELDKVVVDRVDIEAVVHVQILHFEVRPNLPVTGKVLAWKSSWYRDKVMEEALLRVVGLEKEVCSLS